MISTTASQTNLTRIAKSALALLAVAGLTATTLAGPLTPAAGPVQSTMKTLAEVEARNPINATNTPGDAISMAVITQPGSYYLTSDLVTNGNKVGIRILADNVTIDLNGMSVRRGPSATGLYGILDDGDSEDQAQTVTVRNGSIVGFSLTNSRGVYFSGNSALSAQDLTIAACHSGILNDNGPLNATNVQASGTSNTIGYGFQSQQGTTIVDCRVSNFGLGISISSGLVKSCTLYGCGMGVYADRSRVEGCVFGTTLGNATGVEASAYTTVNDCLFNSIALGVKISSAAATVANCTFTSGSLGVQIFGDDAVVCNNTFKNYTTAGLYTGVCIRTEGAATRASIRNNEGAGFNFGISLNAAGCTVTGNRFGNANAPSNAIYSFPIGTRHGPVVKALVSTSSVLVSSSANTTNASTLGSTDPEANLYW